MSFVAIPSTPRSLTESNISTLESLYEAVDGANFTPGWIPRNKPVLWPEPRPQFLPAHWSYTDAKAGLDAGGRLIDVALAERRNLIMRNPAPIAGFETSRTLVAAYQMILPGEHAPSHRHSSHALRVIIDGKGSYSIVDGEKTPMETGDVVLTPGWCWHGHGHDGDRPAYWFDGLDVPLTHLLEPMFFEEHPQKYQQIERVAQTSPYRFRREDIARRLDAAAPDPERFHGARVTLEAPMMPSMGLEMERLVSGTRTRRYRTTANSIFHVVEGSGESTVGSQRFAWSRGDTFVAPGWHAVGHQATSDAQLFVLSDERLLRFSHYYRFEAVE
ncbi:MAG: cupin domain-containing protein [Xanthobacteraceae bacterium]|nr:cupin domain-containing protein [Xanthobacteraceae bacterium]MBV9630792.1 cupin domain-containing protein [Xanthobacteraceae bacterium]